MTLTRTEQTARITDVTTNDLVGLTGDETIAGDKTFSGDIIASGGIKLGGTAAANELDDYEEGIWVPSSPTVAFTSNVGTYTKVGNRVFIDASFVVPTTSSAVSFYVDGFPFNSSSASAGAGFYMRYTDDSIFRMFFMLSSGTRAAAYNMAGGSTSLAEVSGHRFDFSGTYYIT